MDKSLLLKLLDTVSVSGNERSVSRIFATCATQCAMRVDKDAMGNTYAHTGSDETPQAKVLIEAHCDEIGFQVINVADSGYVYVRRNGGIDEQCLPGSQMVIQTRTGELLPAVIGKKPIHLMSTDDRKRTFEIHQLWLDTGMDAEQVKAKVSVGDYVAARPNAQFMGDNRITSKALDNKLGVFILTQVMRRLADAPHPNGVCLAATVQEEVGSRGAVVCAHRVKPGIAITVDVDFATDVPDCNPTRYGSIRLGDGVIIPRNVDCDMALSDELEKIAKEMQIPHQVSARPHATGGTNTSRIQIAQDGVRTISLGIPCRYMHTPTEVCDLRDVEACIQLIISYLQTTQ